MTVAIFALCELSFLGSKKAKHRMVYFSGESILKMGGARNPEQDVQTYI